MKEKEEVYQVSYKSVLGLRQEGPSPEVLRKEEEKIVRSTSSGFLWAGVGALVAGAVLAVNAVVFPLKDLFGPAVPLLASGTAFAAAGLGLYHLYRHVFVRKRINFPSLTIKRKTGQQLNERSAPAYIDTPSSNRVFFGVAGGIARSTGIPATLIRLIMVAGFFITFGFLLIVYLILAMAMPPHKRGAYLPDDPQKRLPR